MYPADENISKCALRAKMSVNVPRGRKCRHMCPAGENVGLRLFQRGEWKGCVCKLWEAQLNPARLLGAVPEREPRDQSNKNQRQNQDFAVLDISLYLLCGMFVMPPDPEETCVLLFCFVLLPGA